MDEELASASYENRTGLVFMIDTHIPDSDVPEAVELRNLHEQGWIELIKSDVLDTELRGASDPERREQLLEGSRSYVEYQGAMVWGYSDWGHGVWGSPQDEELRKRVLTILFPGVPIDTTKRQHIRDAMHVATAIRYNVNGFVTREDASSTSARRC
jgi:hypothetical protein